MGDGFEAWQFVIILKHPKIFLKFDIMGNLCICVHDKFIPMHYYYRRDGTYVEGLEEIPITSQLFDHLISDVRRKLQKVSKMVSSEIRDQFSKDDLVESMSIIHPHFWSTDSIRMSSIYKKYVSNLMKHLF